MEITVANWKELKDSNIGLDLFLKAEELIKDKLGWAATNTSIEEFKDYCIITFKELSLADTKDSIASKRWEFIEGNKEIKVKING